MSIQDEYPEKFEVLTEACLAELPGLNRGQLQDLLEILLHVNPSTPASTAFHDLAFRVVLDRAHTAAAKRQAERQERKIQ